MPVRSAKIRELKPDAWTAATRLDRTEVAAFAMPEAYGLTRPGYPRIVQPARLERRQLTHALQSRSCDDIRMGLREKDGPVISDLRPHRQRVTMT